MLSVVMQSVVMQSVVMQIVVMLSVVMQSDIMLCHYAEWCHYAECQYAEWCRYSECHYSECHYSECHYADFRGAKKSFVTFAQSKNLTVSLYDVPLWGSFNDLETILPSFTLNRTRD
jgi:hypothetical protein